MTFEELELLLRPRQCWRTGGITRIYKKDIDTLNDGDTDAQTFLVTNVIDTELSYFILLYPQFFSLPARFDHLMSTLAYVEHTAVRPHSPLAAMGRQNTREAAQALIQTVENYADFPEFFQSYQDSRYLHPSIKPTAQEREEYTIKFIIRNYITTYDHNNAIDRSEFSRLYRYLHCTLHPNLKNPDNPNPNSNPKPYLTQMPAHIPRLFWQIARLEGYVAVPMAQTNDYKWTGLCLSPNARNPELLLKIDELLETSSQTSTKTRAKSLTSLDSDRERHAYPRGEAAKTLNMSYDIIVGRNSVIREAPTTPEQAKARSLYRSKEKVPRQKPKQKSKQKSKQKQTQTQTQTPSKVKP